MKWIVLHAPISIFLMCYFLRKDYVMVYSPDYIGSRMRLLIFLITTFYICGVLFFLIFQFIKWRITKNKEERSNNAQQERIPVKEYEYRKQMYTLIHLTKLKNSEEYKRIIAGNTKNWQVTEREQREQLYNQHKLVKDDY